MLQVGLTHKGFEVEEQLSLTQNSSCFYRKIQMFTVQVLSVSLASQLWRGRLKRLAKVAIEC